jgi:hypothetical protein
MLSPNDADPSVAKNVTHVPVNIRKRASFAVGSGSHLLWSVGKLRAVWPTPNNSQNLECGCGLDAVCYSAMMGTSLFCWFSSGMHYCFGRTTVLFFLLDDGLFYSHLDSFCRVVEPSSVFIGRCTVMHDPSDAASTWCNNQGQFL